MTSESRAVLIIAGLCAVLGIAIWGANTYEEWSKEREARARTREAILVAERRAEVFKQDKATILAGVRKRMDAKEWDSALNEVAKWRTASAKDPDLAALEATIAGEREAIFKAKQIEDNKRNLAERLAREKAEKQAEIADRARRKKEGVRIGMTEKEVLMSSWGRPESVNRSIYPSHIREQWVYPGFQYLYFDNGVLTSIQTKR